VGPDVLIRMKLFTGTVPANKNYITGTLPDNGNNITGTVKRIIYLTTNYRVVRKSWCKIFVQSFIISTRSASIVELLLLPPPDGEPPEARGKFPLPFCHL
jgi:hypothetical protein